jgi:hypothetical protein
MHNVVAFCILVAVVCFVLGYSLRGAVKRELAVAKGDAEGFAGRLETAATAGGQKLEAEARAIAGELRSKVSRV